MTRHLGFEIPLAIVLRSIGTYWSPGSGICRGCGDRKARVYIMGMSEPYCSECIQYDLAEHSGPSDKMKREQHHPNDIPVEIVWEKLRDVFTDEGPGSNLDIYRQAFR